MRCYNCMKEFEDGYDICPFCGYDRTEEPDPMYLKPGTLLHERYRAGLVAGTGGFGIIYKAWDEKLQTMAAVKEYFSFRVAKRDGKEIRALEEQSFEKSLEQFLEEARRLSRLSTSRYIVDVYDFFRENGTAYIVMEYLEGLTLSSFLKENGEKISLEFAEEIFLSVANAVELLHREHMIHRDISPDNIFLLPDGRVKLIDFGSAVEQEEQRELALTPGYAPPEQYLEHGRLGPWTDLYGMGASMYRALTGIVPEEALQRGYRDTLRSPAEWVKDLPEQVDTLIMRSMEPDIADRISDAGQFRRVLEGTERLRPWRAEKKRKRRRRNAVFAGMVLCLLLTAGGMSLSVFGRRMLHPQKKKLTVWVCSREGQEKAVEAYYREVCAHGFQVEHPDVELVITGISGSQYEEVLSRALELGVAPEIFESTALNGMVLKKAAELDAFAQRQSEKRTCFFLDRYRRYIPEGKRLPVGFSMPVGFVLQGPGDVDPMETTSVGSSGTHAENQWEAAERGTEDSAGKPHLAIVPEAWVKEGERAVAEQFLAGAYGSVAMEFVDFPVLLTELSENLPEDGLPGGIRPVCIQGAEPEFTTTFSLNQAAAQEELALSFLDWLLSEQEQRMLHAGGTGVPEMNACSVAVKANDAYQGLKKQMYSVVEAEMQDE